MIIHMTSYENGIDSRNFCDAKVQTVTKEGNYLGIIALALYKR